MKKIFYLISLLGCPLLGLGQSSPTPVYSSKPVAVNTEALFAPPLQVPQISWETTVVQVNSVEYTLKACVRNKAETYRLEVNGEAIPIPATTRGFVPEGTFCPNGVSFSQPIKLREGKNTAVVVAGNAAGETRSEPLTIMYEKAEKRVALVIGNSEYPNGNKLANPVADATKIAAKLRSLGFEVIEKKNTTQSDLRKVVGQFGNSLQTQKYDVALFYYAGHGVAVGNRNYLIPVDVAPETESEVSILAVSANDILDQMNNDSNQERSNVVILDACRDNPMTRSWNSTRSNGGSTLADMSAPAGSLIAFATKPGNKALDGSSTNSPYTEELLNALDQPGLQLEDVFKTVRVQVMKRTGSRQIPTETSLLTRSVILNKTATK